MMAIPVLDVLPIDFRFYGRQPAMVDYQIYLQIANITGRKIGQIPASESKSFINEVFGLAFEMFSWEVVLKSRNFQRHELTTGHVFWWNEDLHCGVIENENAIFWVMPIERVK